MWKNEKFSLAKKIFRQINSLVISLVKTLRSRNFCQKCVRLKRCNFGTVWKWQYFGILITWFSFHKISVESSVFIGFTKHFSNKSELNFYLFDEIFWRNLRIKCWQTIWVWLLGYFDQSIGIWFHEFSYPTIPWTDFRFQKYQPFLNPFLAQTWFSIFCYHRPIYRLCK